MCVYKKKKLVLYSVYSSGSHLSNISCGGGGGGGGCASPESVTQQKGEGVGI